MVSPWGGWVEYREVTTSTMDDAVQLELAGAPSGSIAWAGLQTQGRGRRSDRRWETEPGHALLMTGFWSPDEFPRFLAPSLVAGVAVCRWAESLGVGTPQIKWPNDIYLDDRKLAGILVRQFWSGSRPRSIHVGIGVNLRQPPEATTYRHPPTSLLDHGVSLKPEQALSSLLSSWERDWKTGISIGDLESRLWKRGKPWTTQWEGRPVETGIVVGVDSQGRLLWRVDGETHVIDSGS